MVKKIPEEERIFELNEIQEAERWKKAVKEIAELNWLEEWWGDNDDWVDSDQNSMDIVRKDSPLIKAIAKYEIISNPGQILQHPPVQEPVDYFKLFFDNDMISRVQRYSNDKIHRRLTDDKNTYRDSTFHEMESYIGCIIEADIWQNLRLKNFWLSNVLLLSFDLTYGRFELITKHLSLWDPDVKSDDKLKKIKPIMDRLLDNMQKYYQLGKQITIHNNTLEFRDDNGLRRYDLRSFWFFKAFTLNDANSGYIQKFHIHRDTDPGLAIDQVCNKLLNGYEGKGYQLYIDKYITSIPLLIVLKARQIDVTGTINQCHAFKKLEKISKNGCIFRRHNGIIYSYTQDYVTYISNTELPRVVQSEDGSWVPEMTVLCSKFMRDKCTTKDKYRLRSILHCKWYKSALVYFLQVAVNNAYVLYENENLKAGTEYMNYWDFRSSITRSLCAKSAQEEVIQKMPKPSKNGHTPIDSGKWKKCELCRQLKITHTKRYPKSQIKCLACGYHLHFKCFARYHKLEDLYE